MTKMEEFCWFLHGFLEITDAETLDKDQVAKIKAKLDECFNKVTPKTVASPLKPVTPVTIGMGGPGQVLQVGPSGYPKWLNTASSDPLNGALNREILAVTC